MTFTKKTLILSTAERRASYVFASDLEIDVLMVWTIAFVLLDFFIFKRLRAIIFLQSKNFSTIQDFSFIKEVLIRYFSFIEEVFYKPKFFLHQERFPQAKIFPLLRKFSSTSQGLFFIKEIFQKPKFFLHKGSFSQEKTFSSSRKFSKSQYFPFIKEVFYKQRFSTSQRLSTNQGFFLIKEVFHKQILF